MNFDDIQSVVEYINLELSKGRTMIDIEKNDFKVNERVMTKRLNRKGYIKVDNQFIINEDPKVIKIDNKLIEPHKIIQKDNRNIEIDKINELISMIEPLKEVILEYNKRKNIVDVKTHELNPPSITEVKQKLFKIDIDVLEKWEQFISEHKQYKVQNLISLALDEFIRKYSK